MSDDADWIVEDAWERLERGEAVDEEAIEFLRRQRCRSEVTLALATAALLPAGSPAAAFEELAAAGPAADHRQIRWLLWQATGDRAHLAGAKELLDRTLSRTPRHCRESMLTNVRVHREILAAAKEHLGA